MSSNWFVDWFCGGLQYQVDHHLFPQIPRHNLKQVNAMVASFCQDHGVNYHESTLYDGTREVLQHLGEVTKEFVTHFPGI